MKNLTCRFFGSTRSCQLARQNRQALEHLSKLFLIRRNIIPIEHYVDLNTQNQQQYLKQSKTQVRLKRSIPGNPCTRTFAYPMVHFYGLDVLENEVVEILQNPGRKKTLKW